VSNGLDVNGVVNTYVYGGDGMAIKSLELHRTGELRRRIEKGLSLLRECSLCPRNCRVNRLLGEAGYCGVGRFAGVASFGPHFGEEAPLVGRHGSGTIFFSSCNLRCCFCQNYDISFYPASGREVNPGELASIMLELQERGCHNINFVTPAHVVVQILEAVEIALDGGLSIPLVYNSSGYDGAGALNLLENVIDIYMPDFKFWSEESGERYCAAPDYPEVARSSLKKMHAQVGDLSIDRDGLARCGLLVRHLLMPEGSRETRQILHFIATALSPGTYLNIMDQYRPCGRSTMYPELGRSVTVEEYTMAVDYAVSLGLTRLDDRDLAEKIFRLIRDGG
jgi:putative pyruvate formate lyase activating enzyme